MIRSFRAMYGLDYVALRYFNVYGPRMDIHGLYTEVLVRWMERIADGQAAADLRRRPADMDFVHVDDIARANMLAAAERRHRRASTTSPAARETSLAGLARGAARAHGLRPARRARAGPRRSTASPPAGRHARGRASDLGFEAAIGLEEGLRELVDWWRPLRGEIAAGRRCAS